MEGYTDIPAERRLTGTPGSRWSTGEARAGALEGVAVQHGLLWCSVVRTSPHRRAKVQARESLLHLSLYRDVHGHG